MLINGQNLRIAPFSSPWAEEFCVFLLSSVRKMTDFARTNSHRPSSAPTLQERQKQRSRESILQAAKEIFAEKSYATAAIEAVIARLGEVFDAGEAAIAERMLREYGGTIPDKQLLSEIGLALAIHRRQKR